MNYPKIVTVQANEDFTLTIAFDNGITKIFDCKLIFENPVYKPIMDFNYFKKAEINSCPYAVVWDDDIDIAESEVWIKGKTA